MNNRRKLHQELEVVQEGYANGVAPGFPFNDAQKKDMIEKAAHKFGLFLDELKCDWRRDPNSAETPKRVAKAYVNDLWAGRYNEMSPITSFPSDGYDGIIIERNIPLTSMCSHHHQTIGGVVHIGYITSEKGAVVGLSKLARTVEVFSKRLQTQERLTMQIASTLMNALDAKGVAVTIDAAHQCMTMRGIKKEKATTVTNYFLGSFREDLSIQNRYLSYLGK